MEAGIMVSAGNRHIRQALEMARQLTALADEGEALCGDDGCAVLYGVIRDCAYTIRNRAEREREIHVRLGLWEETESCHATRNAAC